MSVRSPASRHSKHRRASRVQNHDMTAPAKKRAPLEDDGRYCGASSRARRAANDASRAVSLLTRPDELLKPALNPRELLARAAAPPPLGPFLQSLLMFTCVELFLARACLVLLVERSSFDDRLLTKVVLLLAASPRGIDRIHHQPLAATGNG